MSRFVGGDARVDGSHRAQIQRRDHRDRCVACDVRPAGPQQGGGAARAAKRCRREFREHLARTESRRPARGSAEACAVARRSRCGGRSRKKTCGRSGGRCEARCPNGWTNGQDGGGRESRSGTTQAATRGAGSPVAAKANRPDGFVGAKFLTKRTISQHGASEPRVRA